MKKNIILFFIVISMTYFIGCASSPDPAHIEKLLRDNTVMMTAIVEGNETHCGSGFILELDGKKYIITNFHVVGYFKNKNLKIYLENGRGEKKLISNTSIIAEDQRNDLAVFFSEDIPDGSGLKAAASANILETVIASGFPEGISGEEVTISFASGKISNPRVRMENSERIKLEMKIYPGNSGIFDETRQIHSGIDSDVLMEMSYAVVCKYSKDIEAITSKYENVNLNMYEKNQYFLSEIQDAALKYADGLMEDVVMTVIGGTDGIQSYKVVESDFSDDSGTVFLTTVRINNSADLVFFFKYSRGKWLISEIRNLSGPVNSYMDDENDRLEEMSKSVLAAKVIKGKNAAYEFWLNENDWDALASPTNPACEYEFTLHRGLCLLGIIAEEIYIPAPLMPEISKQNLIDQSLALHSFTHEYRIVNGKKVIHTIAECDSLYKDVVITYVIQSYIYSAKGFGTVQAIISTFKKKITMTG